ncbi:MAG: hypothetical protein GC129_02925 [Proteobacteria bacterium]|nr:hypothetical protein [Pseudomonadota bacterium]
MSQTNALTVVAESAANDLPPLKIGAAQILVGAHHIKIEKEAMQRVLNHLLNGAIPSEKYSCFGNYVNIAEHSFGRSFSYGSATTAHVLMMFEHMRCAPDEMVELLACGAAVGLFHLTANMNYDSKRETDPYWEWAKAVGHIHIPQGRYSFEVTAKDLTFARITATKLVWHPARAGVGLEKEITQLPVELVATSNYGYGGD